MDLLKDYIVSIVAVDKKKLDFTFTIDNTLFEHFGSELLEGGRGKALVELEKPGTTLQATFQIDLIAELLCDRSLELFDYPINLNKTIYFKYGDHYEELSDEIVMIPTEQSELDLSQYIYDFISLGIPSKKLHPKFDGEDESEGLIYSTEDESSKDLGKEDNDSTIDPRWDKLKNLKN